MSLFERINQATNVVQKAGPLVEQGSRLLSDIVGTRKAPTFDQEEYFQSEESGEYENPMQPPSGYTPKRSLRSEHDLRQMAITKGGMVFVLMKSVSVAAKSLISRLLITKGTDEEVTALFGKLEDMADDAGVNVYQFVPSEEQMAELGIIDKSLLLAEGKKAEKKRNLLRALEEENPEVDEVFKGAVIEALYNQYREQDLRGELKADGLWDIVISYTVVTTAGVFSNSGYNVVDMLLDLVMKKKPIVSPDRPKVANSTPTILTDNGNREHIQELVGDGGEEFGQDLSNHEDGPDDLGSE